MDASATTDVDDAMLGRIRALLAKAESTTFAEEAEAFTAKAQELMARHRVDRARVAAAGGGRAAGPTVGVRRLVVDQPYASAKVQLLAAVAGANGGRVIWSGAPEREATVFAEDVELTVVEELFTSLLVQATAAMQRAGTRTHADGANRTRSFRRAFLLAYAQRIGERLRDESARVVAAADAESGGALVPLFAQRDAEVEAAVRREFPRLRAHRTTVSDPEGWYTGRRVADRADLSAGPKLR